MKKLHFLIFLLLFISRFDSYADEEQKVGTQTKADTLVRNNIIYNVTWSNTFTALVI